MPDQLESLFEQLSQDSKLPPVHQWHPQGEKDIGMRIGRDGTWFYQNTPIKRERLVRLFSTVLKREGERHFLVTPVEKVIVDVELAVFLAVQMEVRQGAQQQIVMRTNMDEVVMVDDQHPIEVVGTTDAPIPLLMVRDGLQALIVRSVFYELVALSEVFEMKQGSVAQVQSCGHWFELGSLEQ